MFFKSVTKFLKLLWYGILLGAGMKPFFILFFRIFLNKDTTYDYSKYNFQTPQFKTHTFLGSHFRFLMLFTLPTHPQSRL